MPQAIAPLSPDDDVRYRALMLEAYAREPEAFTSTVSERAALPLSWWRGRIGDRQDLGLALGAVEDERLLGSVALEFSQREKTRHAALVVGLYVRPEARGRGLGRALMEAALAHARQRPGLLQLTLTVSEGNDAALALYRALGFEVFGREPRAMRTATGWRAKLHLWRALDAPSSGDDVSA